MHLYAAIAPPAPVRLELSRLVQDVRLDEPGGRTGQQRWFRRGRAAEPEVPTDGMLDRVATDDLRLELAGFGNLNTADAGRLVALLTEAADEWSPLRLRVAGGVALDWPDDDGAWARLDGDTEGLAALARGVAQVAQRLQVFVDRRRFRPLMKLGTITDATTAPYLEALLQDLETHPGPWWEQAVLPIWQINADTRGPRLRQFADVPLRG